MTIFGTAGTPEGLELVKKSGAHHVFNHRNPGYLAELKEAGNGGFDIIFEMLGNVNLGKDCDLIRHHGTIVVIGARGEAQLDPRLLMVKDATVVGMHLFFGTQNQEDWDDMAAGLLAGFENGTLSPVVHKEYPMERASHAHKDIIESQGAKGNLVITTGQHL
jgi:NADPH2:quinone reductase